ncbi:phosphatidylserine decarboxylase [Streptomyces mayteni]
MKGEAVESRDDIGGVYYGMRDFPEDHTTYVGMVTVGLNSIGSVEYPPEFRHPRKPVKVDKGQKVGNFQYGGSLVILLFESNRFPALRLHLGQRIGTLEEQERTDRMFTGPYHTQSRAADPHLPAVGLGRRQGPASAWVGR